MNFMKKTKEAVKEVECPGCDGTGFPTVKKPIQPGKKIYPAPCKQCLGKGRIALTGAAAR
jgi:DnaJ-class molecular chaperone